MLLNMEEKTLEAHGPGPLILPDGAQRIQTGGSDVEDSIRSVMELTQAAKGHINRGGVSGRREVMTPLGLALLGPHTERDNTW